MAQTISIRCRAKWQYTEVPMGEPIQRLPRPQLLFDLSIGVVADLTGSVKINN